MKHGNPKRRLGQSFLEFSLLAPILIMIVAATISFGLFFFQANVLQQAVDVAAQEISRMPFEPEQELGLGRINDCANASFASQESLFKDQIYDERHLVIRESAYDETTSYNGDLQAYAATLPLLNRLLVSVMVVDRLPGSFDSPGERVLRYPGALVTNPNGDFTVLVPLVAYNYQGVIDGYQCSGETIVEWVAPVEEIVADHDEDSSTPSVGPFSLDLSPTLPSFSPGTVAIRINYPTQATTLINRTDLPPAKNPQGQRGQVLVMADDSLLSDGDTGCYQLTIPNSPTANVSSPQGGRYGLGSLPVLKGQVRPYRKVMTFQAIYRREVFR